MFLKPAEHVTHGGGTIFDEGSEVARLLLDWIRQGAPREPSRRLSRVAVAPSRHVAEALGEPIALRAIAQFSDGTQRDVTKWTIFAAEDPSAVQIDDHTAQSRVLREGRHIVIARYSTEVVPLELVVRLSDTETDLANDARRNYIDDEILNTLETLGLSPSYQIDDGAFLRRVSLDLTGRLPSPERVEAFLADDRVDKRQALVDQLVQSDEFTVFWTRRLAQLLRIGSEKRGDAQAERVYYDWLTHQVRDDISYKQLARTLITASGDTHQVGPANFYRSTRGPREQAEFFSELFMGSRLRCANCHNHPLDRWTQDDYHGLAAIFAKVDNEKVVSSKPLGVVIHPRTVEPAITRIPGEDIPLEEDDPRRQLADWLTDANNPYFAKAIVNRLWKRMMGRGLVEPEDDFRATNPATHPALLDKLAEDFVAHDYSLRHTLKVIANSAAYARSANATAQNKNDDRFYSHAVWRPLESEVLANAITDVLGVDGKFTGGSGNGLSRKLSLFNGPVLNARIATDGSRLRQLLDDGRSPLEIIDEFYMVALGRHPTQQESQHWQQQLATAVDADGFLADFVWGLLASQEFATNH